MLVDDQALIALELEMTIEEAGATVANFVSASDAFAWLETNTPSAAVLDYRIGLETSEALAHTLRARSVPVVFYSGLTDLQGIPLQLQACTWLAKPAPPEELVAVLHKLLSSQT